EAANLVEEITAWRWEQFESWSRDCLNRLNSHGGTNATDSLAFDPSGRLLTLSAVDGHLEVGYPDGLVQLQREVRLLTGLGYPVPSKLVAAAEQAHSLHRYAVVLKQVCVPYTNITGLHASDSSFEGMSISSAQIDRDDRSY
ncbi:unnamed protein product, partial [Dicrocoelium dendriticum]